MQIKCGNTKAHPDGAYHEGTNDVRACYAARYVPAVIAAAPAAPRGGVALLEAPKAAYVATKVASPGTEIPVGAKGRGYFALPGTDGALHFYQVEKPTEGKWAGYTFLKEQASDDTFPVRGVRARAILQIIAQDPQAAGKRYADEIGRCWVCNKTLTDAASREAGIGPVCAARL